MTIEIEVLYEDLKRQKETLENINNLPKDNVLFIIATTTEREGKLGNLSSISGYDNYGLCQKNESGHEWIMLFGWDDGDYVWKRECETCENRQEVDIPLGCWSVIFRGRQVSEGAWQSAKDVFNNEMI